VSLRDLDARLVPRLAGLLRALLDGISGWRQAVADRARAVAAASRAGRLRRLDDRYASRGPLTLLREVPQLGLLLIAVVFLAGAGAVVALSGPDSASTRQQAQQETALPLDLGPAVGTEIDPHFAAARERLMALSRRGPEARHLALVSLNTGLTPEETVELLGDSSLVVRRAYLRAPVTGDPEVIVFQTQEELMTGLRQVFAEIAVRKAKEQQDLLGTAETIEGGTPEEEEFRSLYVADARLAGEEAAAYRASCACVFALVVEGEVRELAELPALPVVRGVELAPRTADLTALDIRPLAPSEQGVVAPRGSRQPGDLP
jgi:hypothetical protein